MALALFYLKYAKLLPTSFTPTFYENHVLINLHDKLSAERKDKYIKKKRGDKCWSGFQAQQQQINVSISHVLFLFLRGKLE